MNELAKFLTKFISIIILIAVLSPSASDAAFPGSNGKLAFQSNRDGNDQIYTMNLDGTGQVNLSNNSGNDQDPAWSPNGSQIAFHSTRDGNHEIYVMDADGSSQINLSNNLAFDPHPSWSPDGAKIAFQSFRDGNQEIYVMNSDGNSQTNLTNNLALDDHPSWSPDGSQIAFRTLRDGNGEIYVMNADGSSQTRLTNNTANDDFPTWSPDGSQLAFHSERDGNLEIYIMNADGSGQIRLTNNLTVDGFPAWSPDGAQIAFQSNRDGNDEIYVMNIDGSSQTNLTNNLAADVLPDWQRLPPPLIVTNTDPPDNGRIIAPNGIVSATFNRAIDTNTVNANTFTVRGKQTGIYQGSYAFSSAVQFDAIDDFKPGEEIVVNLSDGLQADDGVGLTPYAWQFRAAVAGGNGIFADSGQALGTSKSWRLALGDLDGDNDLDAFVANAGGTVNKVWLNGENSNPPGVFSDNGQNNLGPGDSAIVALGDLDNDGDLDAFIANGLPSRFNKVWLNDGIGNFSNSGQSLGTSNSIGLALGDVDGDGDLDAFVANNGEANVGQSNKVWLNDGNGNFSDSGQTLGNSFSAAVALGDLDGDGDLDAFVVNGLGGNHPDKVWLNDGIGNFSDSGQSFSSFSGYEVALGDVDGDGDLDAFIANGNGQGNKVWLNDGTGNFSDSGQSLGSSNSFAVALGDVDGDDDLDAFIANGNDQANRVWLNDGTGSFGDNGQALGNSYSRGVALADVDGDGDLDAFLGNFRQGDKVWLNNSPPSAAAGGPYSGNEGSSMALTGSVSDPDGDSLIVVWTIDSTLCSFNDPASLTPSLTCSDNGAFQATLTVDDGAADPVSSQAEVTVGNVAPTANAGPDQTVFRNDIVTVSGSWTDPAAGEDNPYAWSWDLDGDGTVDDSGTAAFGDTIGRTISFVVDGPATLTFNVTDKDGDTGSDTVVIEVINRAPLADDQVVTTDEDLAVNITLSASDPDSDTLTYSLLSSPSNGMLNGTPPNLTYTPNPNFNGSDSFTFKVNDGLVDSNTATIDITVNPVNDPPQAINDTVPTDEDVAVIIDVQGNDNAGPNNEDQTLTTTAVTDPANGSTAINPDGTVTYAPDLNFNGTDTFNYTVCDSHGACNTAEVTILVATVNDPPQADDDTPTTLEDTPITINVAANDSDVDGNLDPSGTTALSLPANGTLDNNGDGTFGYNPSLNFNGSDSFTYQICDTDNICDSATVNITVTPVNDDPICSSASPSVASLWPANHQFEPVDVTGITDVEGDAISITIDSIFQDEPVDSNGDGSHTPDGQGVGASTAQVRAERVGSGNGRFYHIGFSADDGNGGTCSGVVRVGVPKSQGKNGTPVDNGPLFDSTQP